MEEEKEKLMNTNRRNLYSWNIVCPNCSGVHGKFYGVCDKIVCIQKFHKIAKNRIVAGDYFKFDKLNFT